MKRKMQRIDKCITLNDAEKKVFEVFRSVLAHYKLTTTVRAAGGWVRDKLLGLESDDMDIAVDSGTGEEFAKQVKAWADLQTEETKAAVSSVGTVETNPDQSKHLATACFRVHGLSLDVTNLRTETYALDSASRIPQVAVGTATEDAFRRDLTINSLFYNVNTEAVEDFTNRGIDDLSDGVIRTPLDPADTFREDPLRVLRIIRFAVRFNFRVDPSIFEAAKSASVHEDLLKKVSRERVGIEVGKVLGAARDARRALAFFRDAGLLESVFLARDTWSVSYGHDGLNQEAATQKAAEKAAEGWYSSLRKPTYFLQFVRPASGASFRSRRRRHMESNGFGAVCVLEDLLSEQTAAPSLPSDSDGSGSDGSKIFRESCASALAADGSTCRTALRLATLMARAFGTEELRELKEDGKPAGKKTAPAINVMVRRCLKVKNEICALSAALASHASGAFADARARDPVKVGNAMREKDVRSRWCLASLVAEAVCIASIQRVYEHMLAENVYRDEPQLQGAATSKTAYLSWPEVVAARKEFSLQRNWVHEHGFVVSGTESEHEGNVWKWKQLYNGGDLQKEFAVPKGPKLGEMMAKQLLWQLEQPGITRDSMAQKIKAENAGSS